MSETTLLFRYMQILEKKGSRCQILVHEEQKVCLQEGRRVDFVFCMSELRSDMDGMFNWSKVQIRLVLDPYFGHSADSSFLIYEACH